jgi:hypothetical protein
LKTFLLFLLASVSCFGYSIDNVIDALILVESGGNPKAYNKSENAIGVLQIRPIMVADYNRIYKTNFEHSVAWDVDASRMIAIGIFSHYSKNIDKPNAKHFAFIWNGGGSAWRRVDAPKNDQKQVNLEKYWRKVSTVLVKK